MLKYELTVSFSDCDGLGHVNHAKYFTYMEEARGDVFRMFNPSLKLKDWNLIVASARCDFLKQVSYAEKITVLSWISRLGTASYTIDHAIQNEAGDYVARGQGVLIAYDYNTQKAVPISPKVREELLRHQEGPADAPALRQG